MDMIQPTGLEGRVDLVEFFRNKELLGLDLEPMQECLLTAYDGLDFRTKSLEQRWCDFMKLSRYTARKHIEALLALGRRSGKSLLVSGICLHRCLAVDHYDYILPGQKTHAFVVAQTKENAHEIVVNYAKTWLLNSPRLRPFVRNERPGRRTGLSLDTTTKQELVFVNNKAMKAMPCKDATIRGHTIFLFIGDEIAHWNAETGDDEKDKKLLRAVRPAMSQFGSAKDMLLISSKGKKDGMFYKRFVQGRRGQRPRQLTLMAETLDMRTNPHVRESVEQEKLDDLENYQVEYGRKWAFAGKPYFSEKCVDGCFVEGGSRDRKPGKIYFGAVDPAFKTDRFGLIIGHWDKLEPAVVIDHIECITLDDGFIVTPTGEQQVDHQVAVQRIRELQVIYRCAAWFTDQHQGVVISQLCRNQGIPMEEKVFTGPSKREFYATTRTLVQPHCRVLIPADIEEWSDLLRTEMKQSEKKETPGGDWTVGKPAGMGASDDLVDPLCVVVHACAEEFDGDLIALGQTSMQNERKKQPAAPILRKPGPAMHRSMRARGIRLPGPDPFFRGRMPK